MKEILITSSVLILAVIALRFLFQSKVSRRLIYCAWLLIALRLLVPVQLGNVNFSVLTPAQPVTDAIGQVAQKPVAGPSREEAYNNALQDYITQERPIFVPEVQEQVDTQIQQSGRPPQEVYEELLGSQKPENVLLPEVNQQIESQVDETVAPTLGQIATAVWVIGMVAMAGWFVAVNLSFRRKLKENATVLELPECKIPVKVSSAVASPCLFGLLRPTIYLTPVCVGDEKMQHHVLTHELAHLRSGDHIWAWVRCICLCVYWFNPLVWVAASLSRRDCELACDEAVLKQLGETERLAYGKTLLDMVSSVPAPGQLLETATAMHETKKQLKERMKCIVKKQKVFLTAAIILLMVLAVITGCTFSGAFDGPTENTQPTTVPTTTQNDPLKAMTDYELLLQLADKQDCDILTSFKNSQGAAAINRLVNKSPEFKELLTRETALDSIRAHIYSIAKEQKAYSLRQLSRFYDDIQTYMHEVNGIGPASKALEEMTDYELLWEMAVNERIHKMWLSSYMHSDSRVRNLMFFSPEFAELMTRESAADSIKAYATQIDEKLSLNPVVFSGELLSMIDEIEAYLAEKFDPSILDDPEIQKFNALFQPILAADGKSANYYNWGVGEMQEYASVTQLSLRSLFDYGFYDEMTPTDAELTELKQHFKEVFMERATFYRLPKDKMNAVLQTYFGITLADLPDTAFEFLTYLESTDCYYFYSMETTNMAEGFEARRVEHLSDGTIKLTYRKSGVLSGDYVVVLKPNGDGYQLLSNVYVKSQSSTAPDPTEPTTPPTQPTQPTLSPEEQELAKYQDLLEVKKMGQQRNPYNMALGHLYMNADQLKLRLFFEGGFDDEPKVTDAERAELGIGSAGDVYRLPKDKMDEELWKYFEIRLVNLSSGAYEGLEYLESTGCYYYWATGHFSDNSNVEVRRVEYNKDGTVSVTYTTGFEPYATTKIVTLKPKDDGYQILSNVEPVPEELQELFASSATERNPYFWATGHSYASPTEISLKKFFDQGFPEEGKRTDEEWEELSKIVPYPEHLQMYDCNRLPKDRVNAELKKVFGITLEDLPDSAFDGVYYLESTDCYYTFQTGMDSVPAHSKMLSAKAVDNKMVVLTYALPGGSGAITLKPNGDSWLVVSNIQDMLYG